MKKLTIIITFLFAVNLSIAQVELSKDPEAKKILDAVTAKTKSYESLRIKFSYTIENNQSGEKSEHNGYAFLSGKRYKIIIPGNEIFSDGLTVWTYMKDSEEITITKPDPNEESIFNPAKLFTIYESGYKYLLIGQEKINTIFYDVIDLFPELEEESPYSKIRLKVNSEKAQLYTVETFGKNGLNHTIVVSEYSPNVKITEKLFTFDKSRYPEDIEIIDLR